jgi:hypothetical protein
VGKATKGEGYPPLPLLGDGNPVDLGAFLGDLVGAPGLAVAFEALAYSSAV